MTYTPTQRRLLKMLSDGEPHAASELFTCIGDEMSSRDTLRVSICHLRKKLRPLGQDILIQFVRRRVHYRQVILMVPSKDADSLV